jgi:hypothetical protein
MKTITKNYDSYDHAKDKLPLASVWLFLNQKTDSPDPEI